MKSYVISQHESYDSEGTNSSPVAIRYGDEADVIAEVEILNANITTVRDDLVSHYYTYAELPSSGFGKAFDLPSKKAEFNLISFRNIMERDIERSHVFYNHGKDNTFCNRHDNFKDYMLQQTGCRHHMTGLSEDQIEAVFDDVFANYVKRGIRLV